MLLKSRIKSNVLNQTKNSKPVKSDLTRAKAVKSVNSVRFYEFTKFVI